MTIHSNLHSRVVVVISFNNWCFFYIDFESNTSQLNDAMNPMLNKRTEEIP